MRRALPFVTAAFLLILIGLVLLANVTAPNPTGRRYSSETLSHVLANHEKGLLAEQILARDLGLERNEERESIQCLCGSSQPTTRCGECVAPVSVSVSCIPDFINETYIIDSKAYHSPDSVYRFSAPQFMCLLNGADRLGLPLYIFVPLGLSHQPVEDVAMEAIRATGGDVIAYFAYPGYADPVDRIGLISLIIGLVVLAVLGVLYIVRTVRSWQMPEPEDPPRYEGVIQPRDKTPDPAQRADDLMSEAESFSQRINGRVHILIDDDEDDE